MALSMSCQGRSLNASAFYASLLQAIDGVVILGLCTHTSKDQFKSVCPLDCTELYQSAMTQWKEEEGEEASLERTNLRFVPS